MELAAPVGAGWDELGADLRLYRSLVHRLYNAAIFGLAAEHEVGERVFELEGKWRPYRMVQKTVADLREWGAKKKLQAANFDPGSGLMNEVALEAERKFKRWVQGGKRDRLPTFKHGAPIPVRGSQLKVEIDGGRVVIGFPLSGGRPTRVWRVVARASKGSHWSRLRELATGAAGFKLGSAKLVYDERRKKWYAVVSYSEPAPPSTGLSSENAMVVHRGQHNMLVAMSTNGHFKVIARGNSYLARRRGIEQRRRQLMGLTRDERGQSSRGRGTKRRFATYERLGDLLDRINKTTCQQLGAAVARLAEEWGCGRVFIEDYGGIEPSDDRGERRFVARFPLYQLKQSIEWALRKEGIELEEYPSEYISSTCPKCGNRDVGQHNTRTNVFHCAKCGHERPADFVAAYHAMRRTGVPSPTWDARMRQLADVEANLSQTGL